LRLILAHLYSDCEFFIYINKFKFIVFDIMGFFHCKMIDKIKMKTSFTNLSIKFVNGHIIKFNKTNLSVHEQHKIIISNSYNTLIALLYC